MNQELIQKSKISREKGFIYFINDAGNIVRVREIHDPGKREKSQTILKTKIKKEDGYAYFIDKEGNISRVHLDKVELTKVNIFKKNKISGKKKPAGE